MLTWNATEYSISLSLVSQLGQHPTGLDLGSRYKEDYELRDDSFICAMLQKSFYSLALSLQIWTFVSFQLVDEWASAKWATVRRALSQAARILPTVGKGAPYDGGQSSQPALRILRKVAACFAFRKWSFALGVLEKKIVKETKEDEMEAKCWQNSNCIGFILIGFLK